MDLFPPIEPFLSGTLAVGNGHILYWEQSGNPDGVPVIFVHGGPGAATAPPYRRFFDPSYWRVVMFDQRGCGRSVPAASVEANTTDHLVADMECLRAHLGIERWLAFGGSWGSTLALAYGQAHPDRVLGFVLRGVFLFRQAEVDWFLDGMRNFFPEAWSRFAAHAGNPANLLAAYHALLTNPDPRIHQPAARVWCGFEEACARLLPRGEMADLDPAASLAMARIECHYMVHGGFMAEGQLLDRMARIAHLPATIVQGRYDMVCPPVTAYELARAWPRSRLVIIPDAGHSSMEQGIRSGLVGAVEGMKALI